MINFSCDNCDGTGLCQWCGGTGFEDNESSENLKCSCCFGNKRCPECDGTGEQEELLDD
jgi:hypothetical protein